MTDVQVSSVRRIKLGSIAGLAWSCFLAVLFGVFEIRSVIAVLVVCPVIGAVFATLFAGDLVKLKRLGAILIGVLLVPICAFALGFFLSLMDGLIGHDRGIVDGTGADVPLILSAALDGYMCLFVSVSYFAVLMIPAMCVTMVWLQHKLRRTIGPG